MIEVLLGEEVIKVNTQMSIGQYQLYHREQKKYHKDTLELLSLYLGIEKKKLKKYPKNQVDFILHYLTNEITKIDKDTLVETFIHDGVEYGIEKDWNKLSWGGWQDLEVLSSENIEENIHHIMSILYRPILTKKGLKYTITPYDEDEIMSRIEAFKELPVSYWFGASSFFFLIAQLYITDLGNSLNWMTRYQKTITRGWKTLPGWVRRRLPLVSILPSLSNSQMRILPK
jgi:hypothetical protein